MVIKAAIYPKIDYRSGGTPFSYWCDDNGKYHRIGAPAKIWDDGAEEWWLHGKLHREDGPAYKRGKNEIWYKNGTFHREDGGPARIWDDGKTLEWYYHGEHHRDDGPAIIQQNESYRLYPEYHGWWINGNYVGHEVIKWQEENNIQWPFSDEHLILFRLQFC